uniref:F-box domain-containing protein n=1 Tax=Steinernema glaseri TaxID=37863 RepID=A0A1I7Z0S4_9BILA
MDAVPVCFIESVLRYSERFFKYDLHKESEQLSGLWGRIGEFYLQQGGHVILLYAPIRGDRNECRLHYQIHGFNHIESRTLCPEVAKKISKTIMSIYLYIREGLDGESEWTSINPEDDKGVVNLLMRLEAPSLELNLYPYDREYDSLRLKFEKLMAKYPQLLRKFTSVELVSLEPPYAKLIQDMVSTGRLQSIEILGSVPAILPTSFWVDYFFSDSCTGLDATFEDFNVVLEVITRWKEMDPRHLTHIKSFGGIRASPEALADVGLKPDFTEPEHNDVTSFHLIDHPVDPSSFISVTFSKTFGSLCMCFN